MTDSEAHRIFLIEDAWGTLAFVHTIERPRYRHTNRTYMCAYMSCPKARLTDLTYEQQISLGITFAAIHAPWLDIPASWGEIRQTINHSYWVGIDCMSLPDEQQPTPEDLCEQMQALSCSIKELVT